MRGRAFLRAARQVLAGADEPCWRSAAVDAYYALFLECRDGLAGWGATVPPRHQVHHWVRSKLQYAGDADLKKLGNALERLSSLRNRASYDLGPLPAFSSPATLMQAIRQAETALALLDAIQADPVRRAAAVASLPP
jgi:hypothetical protein